MGPGASDANLGCGSPEPLAAVVGKRRPPALHVMSWNIRRRMQYLFQREADQWGVRAPRLRALLEAEQPALLGVQEALADQVDFLIESLGGTYRAIGHGRDRRRADEQCPIIYDAQRLELLSWEQKALSNHPAQPGSLSWGNLVPRVLIEALFQDRGTGQRLQMINTHFDHLSAHSRLRSAQVIARLVRRREHPTVVTGDLNARPGSAPLAQLLSENTLLDALDAAPRPVATQWGTFAAYRAPTSRRPRVDWILVSPDLLVRSAGINGRQYGGGWGSDHLPVQAVIEVPMAGLPHPHPEPGQHQA